MALLDASALIAVADSEDGWANVPEPRTAAATAVNAAEVVSHLVQKGHDPEAAILFVELLCPILPVEAQVALEAGVLFAATRRLKLSLADCVCLSHARRHGLEVVTSDKAWSTVDIGVTVIQFR